jgi:hypothetical protein
VSVAAACDAVHLDLHHTPLHWYLRLAALCDVRSAALSTAAAMPVGLPMSISRDAAQAIVMDVSNLTEVGVWAKHGHSLLDICAA